MKYVSLVFLAFIISVRTCQATPGPQDTGATRAPEDLAQAPSIHIDLALESHQNSEVSPSVRITNGSNGTATVADPAARMAMGFLVMDEYGNVVTPVGRAKADRKNTTIDIGPHQSVLYRQDKLEFLSGSAEASTWAL